MATSWRADRAVKGVASSWKQFRDRRCERFFFLLHCATDSALVIFYFLPLWRKSFKTKSSKTTFRYKKPTWKPFFLNFSAKLIFLHKISFINSFSFFKRDEIWYGEGIYFFFFFGRYHRKFAFVERIRGMMFFPFFFFLIVRKGRKKIIKKKTRMIVRQVWPAHRLVTNHFTTSGFFSHLVNWGVGAITVSSSFKSPLRWRVRELRRRQKEKNNSFFFSSALESLLYGFSFAFQRAEKRIQEFQQRIKASSEKIWIRLLISWKICSHSEKRKLW